MSSIKTRRLRRKGNELRIFTSRSISMTSYGRLLDIKKHDQSSGSLWNSTTEPISEGFDSNAAEQFERSTPAPKRKPTIARHSSSLAEGRKEDGHRAVGSAQPTLPTSQPRRLRMLWMLFLANQVAWKLSIMQHKRYPWWTLYAHFWYTVNSRGSGGFTRRIFMLQESQ